MKNLIPILIGLLILTISCATQRPISAPTPEIDHSYKIEYTPYRIQLLKEYAEAHYSEYYLETYGTAEWPGIDIDPKVIVLHYTAVPTLEKTIEVFAPDTLRGRAYINHSGKANVGVQFLVDRDGTIYQITPGNYFNRHCIGLNHCAIGFENIGMGDLTEAVLQGEAPEGPGMTLEQVNSNIALVRYLKGKYPGIEILIGHQEYRQLEDPSHPGYKFFHENDPEYRTKKSDPGENFLKAVRDGLEDILKRGTNGQVFK
jgi:N-acetyl-anhydromuramyl-L-alanine amidase AmpD